MQDQPLLVSSLIRHAARHHGEAEIVTALPDGTRHRTTYREVERRSRRLARALATLDVWGGERVATLAWNTFRHLEVYYAVTGAGAVCHTVNPRLHPDDIAYIINHAGVSVLVAEPCFAPLVAGLIPAIGGTIGHVVFLCDAGEMPDDMPDEVGALCSETLMASAGEDFAWPDFDERRACILCYTSGTTGRPKGVLYSHRSTMIHAYAALAADAQGLRAVDRVMPVAPMFHVNGWALPFTAAMAGAALVMPGRQLDGAMLTRLLDEERVTISCGVPTVWLGVLQHLRATGHRLRTLKRLIVGGSACPELLIDAFAREQGVRIDHLWGMTETSPLGTCNAPKAAQADWPEADRLRLSLKQGRVPFGIDYKIVGDDGAELPWDGVAFGDLHVRGPWVISAYFGDAPGSAVDAEGWFKTGDVATIDPHGYLEITDRSKDVIKSGGEWISSIALENIAVAHPDVAEAAVIAARHEKWDERPLLLVVPRPGARLDADAVMARFDGVVAKWWRPDAVVVVDELPHTATGKLKKSELRAAWGNYLVGEGAGQSPAGAAAKSRPS